MPSFRRESSIPRSTNFDDMFSISGPKQQNLVSTWSPSLPFPRCLMNSPMSSWEGPYMSAVSNVVMPAFSNAAKSATAALPAVRSVFRSPRCPPESCQL